MRTRTAVLLTPGLVLLAGGAMAQGSGDTPCDPALVPITGSGGFDYDTTPATGTTQSFIDTVGNSCGSAVPPAPATVDSMGFDRWFLWTAPVSGNFIFDTCSTTTTGGAAIPNYDTKLAVYDSSGNCMDIVTGSPLFVICNEDGPAALCANFASMLTLPAVAMQDYWIQCGGFAVTDVGPAVLNITPPPPPPPPGCIPGNSFDHGDFTGWTSTDMISPFSAAAVGMAGFSPGFGLFSTAPTDGNWSYHNGFDGGGPDTIFLTQDLMVTAAQTPLNFDWRAGWDMTPFGAVLDRTFDVVIRPAGGGAALQTTNILTATAGTTVLDTGPMTSSVDLSPFIGMTVQLSLEWFIPEPATGPALFELDNFTCGGPPVFGEGCNGDGGDGMGCTNCPCGNNAPMGTIGGCINSAGTSSRLLVSGTPTATGSNIMPPLRFEASGITPGNSAQLTSGNAAAPAQAANPCFGLNSGIQSVSLDGLRCAVQQVLRHGVRPSDANGDVGVTTNGWGGSNNFFNYDAFTVGQTKFFQVIHRDDSDAVCLTGQNTTQYIEATFTP